MTEQENSETFIDTLKDNKKLLIGLGSILTVGAGYLLYKTLAKTEETNAGSKNQAFVFIKPHAVTDDVEKLVKENLAAKGVEILTEGLLTGPVIDERKLIDQHYYAIASKATLQKPNELPVPADKFEEKFGIAWQTALDQGVVFNALDACAHLGVDSAGLNALWGAAKDADAIIKFGGGFYCGRIDVETPIYVFNAFFMEMRSKFVEESAKLKYFVVEFSPENMSWEEFRGTFVGPTDPSQAPAESLRGQVYAKYKELGLTEEPNTGDNGIHASASPFEGLAERLNWLAAPLSEDPFGKLLLNAGISEETIKAWSVDPQVSWGDNTGSLFDALEDLDVDECVAKCVIINQG